VPKATVEVLGLNLRGKAPLKAKLERGKVYKARVQAPGFAAQEITIRGGEDRAMARLVPKPRAIAITTDPPGAMIFVDNANSGFSTPHTLELTATQSAKKSVRITLRKNGFKGVDKVIDGSKYTEAAAKMIAKIDEKLTTPAASGNGGSGTSTTAPGGGSASPTSGSAAPPPAPPAAGSAAGSATTGSTKDPAKPAEPEPPKLK
jgi:hypothetical protein